MATQTEENEERRRETRWKSFCATSSFFSFFFFSFFIICSPLSIDFPNGDRRLRRIFLGDFIVAARSFPRIQFHSFSSSKAGLTGPRVSVKAKVSIITPLAPILVRPRRRQKASNLRKRTWFLRGHRGKPWRDKGIELRLWITMYVTVAPTNSWKWDSKWTSSVPNEIKRRTKLETDLYGLFGQISILTSSRSHVPGIGISIALNLPPSFGCICKSHLPRQAFGFASKCGRQSVHSVLRI